MLFSQRIGKKTIKTDLVLENVDKELKNSLWTAFTMCIYDSLPNDRYEGYALTQFVKRLWIGFFKWPIDTLPVYSDDGSILQSEVLQIIRNWYFNKAEWYETLDFMEFCVQKLDENANFIEWCNFFLKKEFSAYRIVGGELVQVTSEEEIVEIEEALSIKDKFSSARTHLQTALQLLSDRKNPDFRNSMKESISAVESLCKIITEDKNSTLGDALKVVEKKYPLHESLKKAFSALYGYTSDSGGIRHSLKDEVSDLKFEDAKFMLVSCSAFVNYLIAKTT
ncbi:MAG: hypothetical protein KA165_11995 [Saprospiraceae bacterium]|nr:hypothetical protein [Saprospiraceae bacterium]